MIKAYIMIAMEPGNTDKAISEMRKISNIQKISVVAGEHDIVVRVHVRMMKKLLSVTEQLQMIKGVKKTTTHVIEEELEL